MGDFDSGRTELFDKEVRSRVSTSACEVDELIGVIIFFDTDVSATGCGISFVSAFSAAAVSQTGSLFATASVLAV